MIFDIEFSALDPAKPWFDLTDESNKISKDDATLVDVIHTNSGFLLYVRYDNFLFEKIYFYHLTFAGEIVIA